MSTVGVQLLGKLLIAGGGVLLARLLGPEDYGSYSYILSIITIATLPVVAGMPNLIIRELSIYQQNKMWGLVVGLISWCRCYAMLMSAFAALFVFFAYVLGFIVDVNLNVLLIALVLVPFRAFLSQQCAFLNAFQRPALAKVPEQIINPTLSMIFILLFAYYSSVTLETAFISVVLSTILSQFIGVILSRNNLEIVRGNLNPEWKMRIWVKSLVPFALIAFVYTLNSEVATVFLGSFSSHQEVGYFKVAIQAVAIIAIGLSSVNSVIMPKIARSYNIGDVSQAQATIRIGVRYSVLLSIFIVFTYIFYGRHLIEFLFGVEYSGVYEILMILTFYQVIDVLLGPVGLVLNMTGNEGKALSRLLVVFAVNVALLFLLVPLYGAAGAAYAMLFSLVLLKVLMCFAVYQSTGLKTYIH
ncbi:oligosaccharide flippase family protein [Vibrio wakamikoensis]|uniref:oligosaccharide flippase family protein n=1 Tax=Vibrio wakamikoensis TaxID=2910251 RepID=UPI003D1CB7C9